MGTLRTKKTYEKYLELRAEEAGENICGLCEENMLVKEYTYWKILNNRFPYDNIAKINHMIIPKRHVTESKLTEEEKKEFSF